MLAKADSASKGWADIATVDRPSKGGGSGEGLLANLQLSIAFLLRLMTLGSSNSCLLIDISGTVTPSGSLEM